MPFNIILVVALLSLDGIPNMLGLVSHFQGMYICSMHKYNELLTQLSIITVCDEWKWFFV